MKLDAVWGTVSSTSPLQVIIDGDDTTATRITARLSSYTPATNDRVLLVSDGAGFMIVGKRVTA